MRFILIRHAHRDMVDRTLDNGLSDKGLKQAQDLAHKLYEEHRVSIEPNIAPNSAPNIRIYSSPRRRCQDTLEPLAKLLKTEIQVVQDLDECHSNEDAKALMERIQSFMRFLKKENSAHSTVIACSHGDWIPHWSEMYLNMEVHLNKSGMIQSLWKWEEPLKLKSFKIFQSLV